MATSKVITAYIRLLALNVNSDYKFAMTLAKPDNAHHHGNLKQALVAYTLSAADQGQLAELSVRKTARELGVSPGAAYRHFPDKDALMRAVAAQGFDALADAFEQAVPFASEALDAAEARARFVVLANTYTLFARNRTELWRLMFGPLGLVPNPNTGRPSTYDWLAKSLHEMARFEVIEPPSPEDQFFAWTAIHGLSDLQDSPAVKGASRESVVDRQCSRIIAALS